MIELYNRCKIDINISFLNQIADDNTDKNIELIISGKDYIKKINKKYRNIDKVTDVLSFPLVDDCMVLGSIIICLDIAKKASKIYNHSLDDEICLLFIHGMLHLLGYDHQIDNGQMRQKEKELIKKYNLPQSLIIRTEG